MADYSAQAVINTILGQTFPSDSIVGEEDAADLRDASKPAVKLLRDRIHELANEALNPPPRPWEKADWGIGKSKTVDELLDSIDRGTSAGGRTGSKFAP